MTRAPDSRFHPPAFRASLTLLLVIVISALATISCGGPVPTLEERAYALDRQLMCPVCDGQTVDQSNAQVSLDMKEVIREKLRAGESEEEILDYFSARYGDAVLASPPTSGFSAVVWIVPPAALLVGVALLAVVMRRMKKRDIGEGPSDADLGDYLAQVDRDLGLDNTRESTGNSEGAAR